MSTELPEIRNTIVLNAPIEKVWKAVATAEGLKSWWVRNTFELTVGKEFVLHAGKKNGDISCKVTEVDEPNRLAFNWETNWTLSFELKNLGDQTELTVVHGGWDAEKSTANGQPHTVVRGYMIGGWKMLLRKLGRII